MMVHPMPVDGEIQPLLPRLIACDHCGIVALDTPAFGWKRWTETEDSKTVVYHHCPAAAQYEDYIRQGLVHMRAPEEAREYEYWPLPDTYWLVHTESGGYSGPFVGRDEVEEARASIHPDEIRDETVVFNDEEFYTHQQARSEH